MSGVDLTAILAFVNARLDEREAAAKAAFPGPWRYNPAKQWHLPDDYPSRRNGEEFVAAGPLDTATCVAATGPADHPQSMADATFIALNDPQFVLADVAAKRLIVDQWTDVSARCLYYERDGEEPFASEARGQAEMLERAIRLLAAPFAQHPDFDPAWAVGGERS